MDQILVYADSLTWGIIPGTRQRLTFEKRWPGVMELELIANGASVRVIEDCLNGRRTVFDDPYKPGRNGLEGIEQRIEVNSPLSLVLIMLGTNDFQSMHAHNAWHTAQGVSAIVTAIRRAPIEPDMPVPKILVVVPPPITRPMGPIADKFEGADAKCLGLTSEFSRMTAEIGCEMFDSGEIVSASAVDGIHLDEEQHFELGCKLAIAVRKILETPFNEQGIGPKCSTGCF